MKGADIVVMGTSRSEILGTNEGDVEDVRACRRSTRIGKKYWCAMLLSSEWIAIWSVNRMQDQFEGMD